MRTKHAKKFLNLKAAYYNRKACYFEVKGVFRVTIWCVAAPDSSDLLVGISHHSVALYLSCRSETSDRSEQLQLVSTQAQVIQHILKAKAKFCGSVKTAEEFY